MKERNEEKGAAEQQTNRQDGHILAANAYQRLIISGWSWRWEVGEIDILLPARQDDVITVAVVEVIS
jgi:Holliday junction resolvase-like predicted endonuclease